MSLAVLILAAGLSRRFGSHNKLLAPWMGRPLVDHAAGAARALAPDLLLATVSDEAVAARLPDFTCLVLANPARGMGHSLALGAAHARGAGVSGLLVLLGDMPGVTPAHLRAVLDAGRIHGAAASRPQGSQARMPPAFFGAARLRDLEMAEGDRGARSLLADLPEAALVAAPSRVLLDIDTPDALGAAPVQPE